MPDKNRARAHLSDQERRLRSELRKLLSGDGCLRGTLQERAKVCGKPNCRCARGERHRALYLVASQDGKLKQLFIPRFQEAKVRRWVETYQRMREVFEQLSQINWDKIRERKS